MMNEPSLDEKARTIFSQFCDGLASIDLRAAVAVPAAIGVAATLYGVGLEVHGQAELLKQGGDLAVEAYRSAMQATPIDSISEYVRLAFAGSHASFGGNVQGVGFGATVVGPALSAATVLLARGFNNVRTYFNDKADHLKAVTGPSLLSTFSGGSIALQRLGSSESSRRGFFVEGRQSGLGELEESPQPGPRPR